MDSQHIKQQIKKLCGKQLINPVYSKLESAVEVIELQGQKPNPSLIFGAMLEIVKHDQNSDSTSHCLFLILVLSHEVPKSLLRNQFKTIQPVYMHIMSKFAKNENVLQPIMGSIVLLLEAQHENIWQKKAAKNLLKRLFNFGVHESTQMRKTAQKWILNLFSSSNPNVITHGGDFLPKLLDRELAAFKSSETKKTKEKSSNSILHALNITQMILAFFSKSVVSHIFAEYLLKFPQLNNSTLTSTTFRVMAGLFASDQIRFNSTFLKTLFTKLLNYSPNKNDFTLTKSYIIMVCNCFKKLHSIDAKLSISFLPQLLDRVLPFFEEESETVTLATRNNLKSVLDTGISSNMVFEALESESSMLNEIISRIVDSLNFKNRSNLDLVLQTSTVLFEKCRQHSFPLLNSLLTGMDQLYATRDFHFQSALRETLGFALRHMGPELFFKSIPFKEEELPRQWLIQLMRNNVIHTQLSFFQDTLIPEADQLLDEANIAQEEENMPVRAKHLRTLYEQIWDTFVAFCQYPLDLQQVFPRLQSELEMKLKEENVCHSVCLGLVKLIESNQNILNNENEVPEIVQINPDDAQNNLELISSSSRIFLSQLFQLHHNDVESKRPLIRQSIDAIASISSAPVLNDEFKRLMISVLKTSVEENNNNENDNIDNNMNNNNNNNDQKMEQENKKDYRDSAMEIALTLVKHLPEDSMDLLFQVIQPQLSDPDTSLQKRSYKALEFICQYHVSYVEHNVESIVQAFMSSLESCSPASNRRRILGLWHLSERLNGEMLERFINEFIVEIVLATKDNNNKTRVAAYDILLSLANHWMVNATSFHDQDKDEALQKFFGKIVAGLGGNTAHMVSATINSITRLFYSFPKETKTFSMELLESIFPLMKNPSKEIALSVLGFSKIALKHLSPDQLRPFINNLMNDILQHTSKEKNPGSLKNRCRVVIERLIRKFGFDEIQEVTPEKHYPLISNIKKTFNRMQKKKNAMNEEEMKIANEKMALAQGRTPLKEGTVNKEHVDFENELFADESEEILIPKKGRKSMMRELGKARKQSQQQKDMWIVDEDEDPMDLADPSAMGQFTGQKPNQKQEHDSEFEIAEDGRMIIVDEEEEEERKQKKNNNDQQQEKQKQNRGEKRKRNELEDGDGEKMELEEDEEETDPVKYAAEQKIKKKRRMNTGEGKITSGSSLLDKKHNNKKKKQQEQLLDRHLTGEKFRNKKAGGDTKRQGDLDPFAYVPLDPRYTNRRNKQKSLKRFGMVVNSSTKGKKNKTTKKNK